MGPEKWIVDSAILSAVAAALNVILVGVLARITWKYANSTAAILEEARRARLAAERQATAAQESVGLLQQELEERLGLGREVVQSTIASALSAIEYWLTQDLTSSARAPGFPPTDNLLPANELTAVEHARRLSLVAGRTLSAAFDDLRNAISEIERMRAFGSAHSTAFLDPTPSRAKEFLTSARVQLQGLQKILL